MRIAMLAPPWLPVPPPAYGGTEAVIDGLCRGLIELGHDVLLFASGDSRCPVDTAWTFDTARGVESLLPATELSHVLAAYERLGAWKPDIVHDHTVCGPFHADRIQATVVTTNHAPFDGDFANIYRALSGRVPIIAISAAQAATARVPVEAVIHHGIDVDRYPEGKGEGDYAFFLGRMSPAKGVHVAIRAARDAGVPLVIAAKMRHHDEHLYFDEHVRPLLGAGVEYVGEVGGDHKLQLLGDARCLLNPIAWSEPFGMVMIEALACGTPVVATPLGAATEIVEDGVTGYLRSDEASLSRALQTVNRINRRTCRLVAEERFSLARMAADHVVVYERLIAR